MPDPLDMIKITEVFLVPSTVLVGALGVATTEPLKAGTSFLGIIVSGVWLTALCDTAGFPPTSIRYAALFILALIFFLGWIVSFVIHGRLVRQK